MSNRTSRILRDMREDATAHAREFWGYLDHPLEAIPSQDLKSIETRLTSQDIDPRFLYVPTRFEPDESFQLAPIDPYRRMPTFESLAQHVDVSAALVLIPEFWTIEPLWYRSCVHMNVVHAPLSPSNIPAAIEIMRQVAPEIVSTDLLTARKLDLALDTAHVRPPALWHIVVPLHTKERFRPSTGRAIHDIHVFPGMSIAHECAHGEMHPSNDTFWEQRRDGSWLTSTDSRPLPLLRFSVPYRMHDTHCHCSAQITLETI